MAILSMKPADGVEGCLIYVHGRNTYMFRVYAEDGTFKDYDLMHCDLGIVIKDVDSCFYEHGDGHMSLDHAPETLGIKE